MRSVAEFDFNGGKNSVYTKYSDELFEIKKVIENVDAESCRTKESHEKTMPGKILYSPRKLNVFF
ncbi:hypothetical protein [Desulfovibrio sp. SGI.169]|uniref:hypothetical protein n=1 Tax=Desulfovibrio sp. SGI.169 TaxID=3420561 RepID=UPI003D014BAE